MDQKQAIELLGLSDNYNQADIDSVFTEKLESLKDKKQSAPTDALKEKFEELIKKLNQAKSILHESHSTKNNQPNPLTQTKLADLPGSQPFQTQMEDGTVSMNIEPGQILADRYEIKEQIGSGGMGAVYHAYDKTREQDIALKVLLPSLANSARAKERFLNEAKLSSQLSHPSIANVFDVQQDGDYVFLSMELLEGQDLRSLMQTRKLTHQEFSQQEAKELANTLCDALSYAHKHTVHRDIKPENIWVNEEGEFKLMDFGIARVMSNSQRTKTGLAMGTAYYMAPEQLKGTSKVDGRADIYALGVMLYELLVGEVPMGRFKPLKEIRKDVDKALANAIDKALEPNPDERYKDAEAFKQTLNKKGASVGMPSIGMGGFDIKKLLPIAAVLIVVIGLGIVLSGGGLGEFWESIKPVSKEEITRQKAEVARSLGEIKTYKKRLENGQRQLTSDVKDAERNKSKSLKALQHWKQLTDNAIFSGSSITELEGELSVAETLLRENAFELAKLAMDKVRDGYKGLWENFSAAEGLYGAEKLVRPTKALWQKRGDNYAIQSNHESEAEKATTNATSAELGGEFIQALAFYQQAKDGWQAAIDSTNSMVVEFKNKQDVEQERIRIQNIKSKQDRKNEKMLIAKKNKMKEANIKREKKERTNKLIHSLNSGITINANGALIVGCSTKISCANDFIDLSDNTFHVDSSVIDLFLVTLNAKNQLRVEITDPSGMVVNSSNGVKWLENEGYSILKVNNPDVGKWSINSNSNSISRVLVRSKLSIFVENLPNKIKLRITANVNT